MKKRIIIACVFSILLLSAPLVSSIEFTKLKKARTNKLITQQNTLLNKITTQADNVFSEKHLPSSFFNNKNYEKTQWLTQMIQKLFSTNMNEYLLQIIGTLAATLLFFVITQPFFLQAIVTLGYETILFPLLLTVLILLEITQKYFLLKVIGLYENLVSENIDGFFNFFSIVFLFAYFKIVYSYLPQYIVQYSGAFTRSFYYLLMFALPILFNFCLADSIDLIDWNGDERPIKKLFSQSVPKDT